MSHLIADIGGTNTRCAIVKQRRPQKIIEYRNDDFGELLPLLNTYLAQLPSGQRPESAAIAVAAPIHGEQVHMINRDWAFSVAELKTGLGLKQVRLLNDFEALAYALPVLEEQDLRQIGRGTVQSGKPKAVLGPGTGLGVAGLVPADGHWQAIAGEGGHVSLPASGDREAELIRSARQQYGHCSAERLISGPGLTLLHSLLHGVPESEPAAIGRAAETGNTQAVESLETMFRLLGTVAGDLALTLGAFGGIYIGGGIVPRHTEIFARSGFRERFEDKGRYREYLGAIPTFVITADNPTLTGLAALD
ncbi:MAG TPA: glucokinase [Chromatiales bacterium]|nr:glucokinase [Chromatiales bacterium]